MNAMLIPPQPPSGSGDQSTALLRQSAAVARERGNLKLANLLYREILCRYPEDSDAAEALRPPAAADLDAAGRASPIRPTPPAYLNIATASHTADAYVVRGTTQRELGRFEESLDSSKTTFALRDDARAKFALGRLSLLNGDLDQDWPLVAQNGSTQTGKPDPPEGGNTRLRFDNDALRGKVLHLRQDRDVRETLQFARYARLAENQGATVVLSVQENLRGLLQSLSPTLQVLCEGQASGAFDYRCALSALPGLFGTTRETIPAEARYLLAEGARANRWSKRLGEEGFKIGVCWQAGNGEGIDKRSFPLPLLEPISKLPGVRLISLQEAGETGPFASLPAEMSVEAFADLDAGAEALLDAAAIIECLDLVITCDSAIAHLAGALGAQTWVVLPRVPDSFWMLERRDSPWYPTLRLFRQSADCDFGAVIEAMSMELKTLLDARPAQPASPVLGTAPTLAGTQVPDGTPFSESPVPFARDETVARLISRSSPTLPLRAHLSAPKIVSGVLVALLCAEVVNGARAVLPHKLPPAPTELPPSSRAEIDVSPIVAAHLFGQTAGASVLASAPPAASDLTLTATLATRDPARGLAIIGEDGKSSVYSVGRAIADVSLRAVYADRVVIERNGRLESLYLPRKDLDQAGVMTTVASDRPPSTPGSSAASLPAASIDKYLDSFVVTDNFGNLVGIRVVPGQDRAGFARSGLAGGDVVVAMNGLSGGVADSWKQAANGTTVTVLRRGVRRDITLNLPD